MTSVIRRVWKWRICLGVVAIGEWIWRGWMDMVKRRDAALVEAYLFR